MQRQYTGNVTCI